MRAWRVAGVVSLLAACGVNPAFEATTSTTGGDTTNAAATIVVDTTTGAPVDPTTTGATTLGLEATGDVSTSLDPSSPATASTGDATTTTEPPPPDDTTTTDDATTGAPQPGECPADPGLIACYRFEEDPQSKELIDGSMYGHHGGRAMTNAVASVAGFDSAVDLIPNSDVHIVHDPDFAPAKLTIAAFVFVKQGQTDKGLIDREGSYRLSLTDAGVRCEVHTDDDDGSVTAPVVVERWYHFTCTHDGEHLRLYVHGEQVDSTTEVELDGEVLAPEREFIIGRLTGDDGTKYSGWMDQVMVYDRAVTGEQACDLAGPLCP